ncbi:hypothetical protein FKW77_009279 [Venturia effusa]|uniref:Ubiquitin-like protease family profile domain-containing protein n=1 Tax=Venturia effusa TaxID=50376 RepID=A0A517L048_9PEZI|nr:hypothetical protein FKW77_009279 [Venturia effusa]
MVSFLSQLISSLTGNSQEEEEPTLNKNDAQTPNSSPDTLRKEPSQSAPPRSLELHESTSFGGDALQRRSGAKKSAAKTRATSDEGRLLGDYSNPADATYIQAPRSTPPPVMPPNVRKYYKSGHSIAGRNTLYDRKKTATTYSSKTPLATTISRGENVRPLADNVFDFQNSPAPDHKRRKINQSETWRTKQENPAVIDLDDGEDDHSSRSIASKPNTQKRLRVSPLVSGVQESRNVDRIMSSYHASHNVGSKRPKDRYLTGQTHSRPVMVEDDPQTSGVQFSDTKGDIMTPLDDKLKAELREVRSQNKKRPCSENGASTSQYFSASKRPKTAMEDVVNASDDELEEVGRPPTNIARRNGSAVAAAESLRRTFVPDNRISRQDRSAFDQDGEDMTDELAEAPGVSPKPNAPSKQADIGRSEPESFEIAETPSPRDDNMSSADIPQTLFSHVERGSAKKPKLAKKQTNKVQNEENYPLISYKDGRTPIPESQSGSQLRFNDEQKEFELNFGDETVVATINLAKVKNLHYAPDECNLVRVQGVRESLNTLVWDLNFRDAADMKRFALQLKDLAKINLFKRSEEEMRSMFNAFPVQRSRTERVADVVDRNAEDKLLERRINNFHSAEKQLDAQGSFAQQRPHRKSTLISQLQASVPEDIQQANREQRLPDIKYENETEVHVAKERPKRSTRANKVPVRSPTPEIERFSVTHGLGKTWDQPVMYPGRDKAYRSKKQVSIEFDDLYRLDEGEWFNDSLVEYCLLYYQQQNERQASKVYFFSNFFYSKLVAKGRNIDYEAVRRWVKEDIFTYDFVVVPVCENAHWYLALICNLSHLQRKLGDDDDDVVEEVKTGSIEHNGQIDKLATTDAPDVNWSHPEQDQANSDTKLVGPSGKPEDHQTHQVGFGKKLDISSANRDHKIFGDEDAIILVGEKTGDIKQKSEPDVGSADSVSGDHTKTTATTGPKKKAKRQIAVRKYPPDTPVIAILDSMPSGSKHNNTIYALKDFLIAEASAKRGMSVTRESFQGMHITRGIPMQDNFSDCGLFLCRYVRELLKDPERFSSKLLGGELDTIDWGSWDTNEVRATIRAQLQDLAAEQSKQRKEAKAERRKAKREALSNASVQTATESSAAPPDTPADLPPSSPIKASSPVEASSPVRAPKPREPSIVLDSPARARKFSRSSTRSPNPVLRSNLTSNASKTSQRGVSDEPRYSARSSPVADDVHSSLDDPISIYEDNEQGLVDGTEQRDDSEDSMLHDRQVQEEAEEEEFKGFSDDDEQVFKSQLLEAAASHAEEEKNADDVHDSVEEPITVSDTPEGSPMSSAHPPPATKTSASQRSVQIPAFLEHF